MSKNLLETLAGFVVILFAGYFIFLAYDNGGINKETDNTYTIFANFEKADGITKGSDIKIAGIKVGRVSDLSLNKDFVAKVHLSIDDYIKLPTDSSASILSDGLLGSKYISLTPGADEETLVEQESIEYTQSTIILENLISKFIFGSTDSKDKK